MNYKLIPRNEIPVDKKAAAEMSQKLGLHPCLVELLFSRGIDSESDIQKFLHPDESNFYDPFLLKGMKEAVARIETAIQNAEKVVIYGDYDADGVCAAAILALYLSSRGLDVYTHIPNRVGDGYGLNIDSIEKIIENCCPDLIITCDCGISGKAEVEHANDLGVDVIVTDHHEVSDSIPECIVVNPKQSDCGYPYDALCGAGVALKVVQALGGAEAAKEYLDLAAVATIADLVPLLDENRLIVQLGLACMKEKKNLGLTLLLEDQKLSYPVTSSDIAYKIAPRINAAGRMGDAYRAFEMLTSKSVTRVSEIIRNINEDNIRRKQLCDRLYNEAIEDLQFEDLVENRSIILSNPEWEKGITGILAARLAGDFKRPSFVMVNSGEQYKGTSRSIPEINIYDLLSSVSDILVEFGGHSQAAGFSIKQENIPLFKQRVNEYLRHFPEELFEPSLAYDLAVDASQLDLDLARALEVIEPSGNGNTRPLFKTTVDTMTVTACKSNYLHTNITLPNGVQVLAFNFYSQNQFLMGEQAKDLILELQLNTFAGRESAKGILRGVSPSQLYVNDTVAQANFLKTLAFKPYPTAEFIAYSPEQLPQLVGDSIYGTLIIAGCEASYRRFCEQVQKPYLLNEFLYATSKNNYSRIIVSPEMDGTLLLSNYSKIIFLDTPPGYALLSYLQKKTKATVYLPQNSNEADFYRDLLFSREEFGKYFDAIRRNSDLQATNILTYFKLLNARHPELQLKQFIACVIVFSELNLIKTGRETFEISVNRDVKRDLNESELYRYLSAQTK